MEPKKKNNKNKGEHWGKLLTNRVVDSWGVLWLIEVIVLIVILFAVVLQDKDIGVVQFFNTHVLVRYVVRISYYKAQLFS